MTIFIESINIRAMKCVRKGYNLPTKANQDGNRILKPVDEYSNTEIQNMALISSLSMLLLMQLTSISMIYSLHVRLPKTLRTFFETIMKETIR